MNAVGIDVSKGKSTVAVIQPFGVVVAEPFDVLHTDSDLKKLVTFIKSLSGETKVVMEYTGTYYVPIANALHNACRNSPQNAEDDEPTVCQAEQDTCDAEEQLYCIAGLLLSECEYAVHLAVQRV